MSEPKNVPPTVGPARHIFAITPSDDDYLPYMTRAIRVGAEGDLVVVAVDNPEEEAVTIPNCQAGERIEVQAVKVLATGTTASGLVGYSN